MGVLGLRSIMNAPRVGLIGVSGYSRVHLNHLWIMHGAGEIVFAAVVAIDADYQAAACEGLQTIGCEVLRSVDELVAASSRLQLDLCIVPTPIHLHREHTIALLEAGMNVLV